MAREILSRDAFASYVHRELELGEAIPMDEPISLLPEFDSLRMFELIVVIEDLGVSLDADEAWGTWTLQDLFLEYAAAAAASR